MQLELGEQLPISEISDRAARRSSAVVPAKGAMRRSARYRNCQVLNNFYLSHLTTICCLQLILLCIAMLVRFIAEHVVDCIYLSDAKF